MQDKRQIGYSCIGDKKSKTISKNVQKVTLDTGSLQEIINLQL